MQSRISKLWVFGAVVMAVGTGLAVSQPPTTPKSKEVPPAAVGGQLALPGDFVPRASAIVTKTIGFEAALGLPDWLVGRTVDIRVVPGVTPVRVLPVYVIKEVTAEALQFKLIQKDKLTGPLPTFGTDGTPQPPKVHVVLFDAMTDSAVQKFVTAKLNADSPGLGNFVIVPPEANEVAVGLSVAFAGNKIRLGETNFTRAGGQFQHHLEFKIDPSSAGLLVAQPTGNFRLDFAEDYAGLFSKDELVVTAKFTRQAFVQFQNTILKNHPATEPVVMVRFGGGARQDTAFRQYLQTVSEIDVQIARDTVLSPQVIEAAVNDAIKAGNLQFTEFRKIGAEKDDKLLTFVFGNGMTVRGSLGTFRKISKDDKALLEKLMESRDTWDIAREYFGKLKVDAEGGALFGLVKGKGGIDTEFGVKRRDTGSTERKDMSKEVRELFQTVEGELPVVALDVKQLQKAATAQVDVSKLVLGTFVPGRQTLLHNISFQTLNMVGTLPEFATDLEKRVAKLESQKMAYGSWEFDHGKPVQTGFKAAPGGSTSPSHWIRFTFPKDTFSEPPILQVGITCLGTDSPSLRIDVQNVTKDGFELRVVPMDHAKPWTHVGLNWVAFPKTPTPAAPGTVLDKP